MQNRILGFLTAVALVCGVSSRASAAPITINFVDEGKVGIVKIHSTNLSANNFWVYAGELIWSMNTPQGLTSFYSYCVDVNNWAHWTQSVEVLPSSALSLEPTVIDAGGKAAWLINTYAPWIHEHGTNDDAAALQVAIWTVLYQPTGTFWLVEASGIIMSKTTDYLNALNEGGGHTSLATWFDAAPGEGQDQMAPSAVPEPASILLLSTGLAWTGARFRRRSTSV